MTSRSVHRAAGFVAVLLAAAALCASAADWPIYRGPEHNGISAETGWFAPGAKLSVAWSQKVGTGCSSMTVVGERLFTMGNIEKSKDVVYCFNAADGKLVWKFAYDCPLSPKMYEGGPNATPTVADGKVYTLSKQGDVFCLDAATGEKVWSVRLGAKAPTWGYASSLLVLGKSVLLNAGDAGTALDKDTGKVLWSSGEGPGGYSTPVPYEQGGQTLIALFSRRSVVGVQAADGKKVWEHEWKTSYDVNAADPVLIDGGKKVFISSGYNSGCMLLNVSGGSATEAWRNKNMRNKHTNSVVQDGAIFGFDESVLTCLDLATGEKKWTQSGLGSGALVLADGKLVLLAEKGKVVVAEASPAGFKELASVQAVKGNCWAAPTLAHGRIYARSKAGDLACVTIEK
ncbi:MAG TPA: PQQ-binding-like beta-propeller repeat protein [Phycisphaerae bacterium]|nr:PQQ-binding-like beta-propeller repeat protein [Phycisphaerae bacterium]